MQTTLRYGVGSVVELEFSAEALVADCQAPRGKPLGDVPRGVAAALAEPLEFPTLAESVAPGDRIVVAIESGVPRAEEIARAIADAVSAEGIEPANVCVLWPGRAPSLETVPADPSAAPVGRAAQLEQRRHDPADRGSLAYLANIGEGKPVYLNRSVCEADFLAPVGCARLEAIGGLQSPSEGLFPTFADAAAQSRYRSPRTAGSQVQRRRLRQQAREVEWLLGAMFAIRVVPGSGDSVLSIVAGETRAVERRSQARAEKAWRFTTPAPAELVVAGVEGASQQTWSQVARALAAAERAAAEDGAIVLLTDLDSPLGPALQHLAGAESPEDALREITHHRPADALVASQVIHTLENHRVYLVSQLEPDVVESLGMAPVGDVGEVRRLAARAESCVVLANAQHALAEPEGS